jgi:hypothetical protein
MRFLRDYIQEFLADESDRKNLGQELQATKNSLDVFAGGNPELAFEGLVQRYNWLGEPENKLRYKIDQNLARNLPGAILQDYLLHLVVKQLREFPALEVFTEVRVPFGRYPLWNSGTVVFKTPSELSDIAVGYLTEDDSVKAADLQWPRQPFYRLGRGQSILPLVTINTKIRISQSEFFDWQGREQLMTKGNPHCLSVQVALRKEMDDDIVEAAQARGKFFLLGEGGERSVRPNRDELKRFIRVFREHVSDRMSPRSPEVSVPRSPTDIVIDPKA